MSSQQGSNSSSSTQKSMKQDRRTIDELATAFFVHDIRRALGALGCTPQCGEYWGICEPMDAAHDFVTAGPCFEPLLRENDDADGDAENDTTHKPAPIPTKIEVMFDGEADTVMSSSLQSEGAFSSGSSYESFRGYGQRWYCGEHRAALLTNCSKCLEPNER